MVSRDDLTRISLDGDDDEMLLLERLSSIEHEQWWQWALHLMQTEPNISAERLARWKGSMVPYRELTEENKEHDRIWARRVMEVLRGKDRGV